MVVMKNIFAAYSVFISVYKYLFIYLTVEENGQLYILQHTYRVGKRSTSSDIIWWVRSTQNKSQMAGSRNAEMIVIRKLCIIGIDSQVHLTP